MTGDAAFQDRYPTDLVAASLDLARSAHEAMLHRLRIQNRALDRLRSALAAEDGFEEPAAGSSLR